MDKIYGVYGTSRSKKYDSEQGGQNKRYSGSKQTYNALKAKGTSVVDALEYKHMLDTVAEGKQAVRNVDKFKSLISNANEKLTSKIAVAPLKDDSYDYETNKMMSNGGMAAKMRMERTTELNQINARRKSEINSYTNTDGRYKRDLGYDTRKYDSYADNSPKNSGYNSRTTYNSYTNRPSERTERNYNILPDTTKKESFWSKIKRAVKEFFKSEPKEEITENINSHANRVNEFKRSIPKAAPQIDASSIEKKKKEAIRAAAIESK